MMDDRLFDRYDPGGIEVLRRLEAYADARLTPTVDATMRARAAVMDAAHGRAALLVGADAARTMVATPVVAGARAPIDMRGWRRLLGATLAGTVTLAILAGTAFAARPGGPLYPARLWTEAVNLPATGLPRAQAEIERLQARVSEAQQAAAVGDGPALQAAIVAYMSIVAEAMAGVDGDAAAAAALEAALERHMIVLTALLDKVPEPARAGIQNALASSTKVLDKLHDVSPPAGGNDGVNLGTGGKGGTGGDGGGAGGAGAGAGGGGSEPEATPTPKPPKPTPPGHTRTPRPTRTDGQKPASQPTPPSNDSQGEND